RTRASQGFSETWYRRLKLAFPTVVLFSCARVSRFTGSSYFSRATCRSLPTFRRAGCRQELSLSRLRDRSRMPLFMGTLVLIAILLIPAALFGQNPADDDEEPPVQKSPADGFQFKFKERPSVRIGDD